MNRQPTSTASQPARDIDALLGRFSAWSAEHGSVAAESNSQVRELSYEQAIRTHARKRRMDPLPARGPGVRSSESPAAVIADSAESARAGKEVDSGSVAKGSAGPATVSQRAVKRKPAAGRRTMKETDFAESLKREASRLRSSMSAELRHETALTTKVSRETRLTVRFTSHEHALVQARAAEAKTSVSSYLRQCALEVELLRKHVEAALAEVQSAKEASFAERPQLTASRETAPPAMTEPGFLRRAGGLGLRVLRALCGKPQQVEWWN